MSEERKFTDMELLNAANFNSYAARVGSKAIRVMQEFMKKCLVDDTTGVVTLRRQSGQNTKVLSQSDAMHRTAEGREHAKIRQDNDSNGNSSRNESRIDGQTLNDDKSRKRKEIIEEIHRLKRENVEAEWNGSGFIDEEKQERESRIINLNIQLRKIQESERKEKSNSNGAKLDSSQRSSAVVEASNVSGNSSSQVDQSINESTKQNATSCESIDQNVALIEEQKSIEAQNEIEKKRLEWKKIVVKSQVKQRVENKRENCKTFVKRHERCPIDGQMHSTADCKLSVIERYEWIKARNACKRCLKSGHTLIECIQTSQSKKSHCYKCDKEHHMTILHEYYIDIEVIREFVRMGEYVSIEERQAALAWSKHEDEVAWDWEDMVLKELEKEAEKKADQGRK